MATVAILEMHNIIEGLMLVDFEQKCVTWCIFSIIDGLVWVHLGFAHPMKAKQTCILLGANRYGEKERVR